MPTSSVDNLPEQVPAIWPGARYADLIEFIEEHYGKFIGHGLTMEWIRTHDKALYRAIDNYKQKNGEFSLYIPTRSQVLNESIEKLRTLGISALSRKERTAIGQKLRRLQNAPGIG